MTSTERITLKRAILHLTKDDGNFEEGMGLLCELAGIQYPALRAMQTTKTVNLRKLAAGQYKRVR